MASSAIAAFTQLVEARPPERPSIWFDTTCVLGGSIAGLLAARVLADHARRVVVIERDLVNVDGRSRAGVPQDRQVHVLLPGGRRWLEHWLPGLTRDLQDQGAVLSGPGQFVQYTDGRPQVHERPLLTASRPLQESRIRARVLALPNVSTRRSQVTGLEYRDGRVTAVRYRSGQAAHVLPADLVVDANAHSVQLDLFYDYRTNAAFYPTWQERLRTDQPKTLIFWGQGDIFFIPEGGEAYLRDLPDARMVRLNSGHFAVEDCLDEIVSGVKDFYDTNVK